MFPAAHPNNLTVARHIQQVKFAYDECINFEYAAVNCYRDLLQVI